MDIELWKNKKKELNLTFDDLAKTTGVSVRTLKSLFSGERKNTTTFTKQAIEKALGITKDVVDVDISQEEKDFIEVYRQLTQEEKIEFNNIASFILSKRQ